MHERREGDEDCLNALSLSKKGTKKHKLNESESSSVLTRAIPVGLLYSDDFKLAFEKEMLGVYLSGHPLESYQDMLKSVCNASSLDFAYDEEEGMVNVAPGKDYILGGIASVVNIKLTRNNQRMAFITLEDLVGSVEVIVFPRDFENYKLVDFIDNNESIEKYIVNQHHTNNNSKEFIFLKDNFPLDFQVEDTLKRLYKITFIEKQVCCKAKLKKGIRAYRLLPISLNDNILTITIANIFFIIKKRKITISNSDYINYKYFKDKDKWEFLKEEKSGI